MSGKKIIFAPGENKDARTVTTRAISFTYCSNFNLEDGDTISIFRNYAGIHRKSTGMMGLYDASTGEQILTDVYDSIEVQTYNPELYKYTYYIDRTITFFEVCVDGKAGVFDESGNHLIPIEYERGITMVDGFYFVKIPGEKRYGVYDSKGNHIVPDEFSSIDLCRGIIIACKDTEAGTLKYAYDKDGNSLFTDQFDSGKQKGFEAISVTSSNIIVKENNLKYVYSRHGRLLIKHGFTKISSQGDFFLVIDQSKKHGAYSVAGEEIIPCEYNQLTRFSNGYIKGKYGNSECLIDKNGNLVVEKGIYKNIVKSKGGAYGMLLKGKECVNISLK